MGTIEDDDAVVLFNFRADRMVQISKAFEYEHFDAFDRKRFPKVTNVHQFILRLLGAQVKGSVLHPRYGTVCQAYRSARKMTFCRVVEILAFKRVEILAS